ncbi:glycosyltransferase family 2 protein [Acidimangrovimonas pyrenivorans]|uniref:Glycosyltransferase family 2 protein n=1 Tax=Acidimangrovimonas pyrenivorans TaxID=2030798 RepID=A0ABV7AKA0_9RHOB
MAPPRASVIVVSRHRPAALRRCLEGIAQLDHPAFEVIVVADPAALATLALLEDRIKMLAFDAANISAARNAGLAMAAGEVVAFIDDDAVPEPTWLRRLAAPFAEPGVAAAGGFVRGRNGISFQWKAMAVDQRGRDVPLTVDAHAVSLHDGDAARAVKTQGTNMAFRRDALLAIGGFDEALRFYLDEADVNLRLAAARHRTAIVPRAQVHHGFLASTRRRADRAPLDLTEIGASSAVFLRRHAPEGERAAALDALRQGQRRRLIGLMVEGRIAPGDVGRLLAGLEAGIAEGRTRALPALAPLAPTAPAFLPFPGAGPRPGRVLAGRPWARRRLRHAARRAVAGGAIVTLFRFSPTALAHRMRFDPEGFWEQTGGLFGRSDRDQPRFRLQGFRHRLARERARVAGLRPLDGNLPDF